jgi:predicted acylesterase/phospholipase RssA
MIGRRSLLPLAAAMLAGCSALPRGTAVPRGRAQAVRLLGIDNARLYLGAESYDLAQREFLSAMARSGDPGGITPGLPPFNLLAISGGGDNGAFGAGLLVGWTAAGTRPQFDLVTGVSTGALTAPFAFLGPAYDGQLRAVYTEVERHQILIDRSLLAAVMEDALADNAPLYGTIARYLDRDMLTRIADAYGRGRLLFISTTDLDQQMPVFWNIGAIAASGHPDALDLVRRLLLASAAVPGAFPPQMIDVEVDGRRYQEMHVDGGAVAQAFLYPPPLGVIRQNALREGRPMRVVNAWVIRNARLDPEWNGIERRVIPIVGRAISTLIAASGYNDAVRLWFQAQRDAVTFRLGFIGPDFNAPHPEEFDQTYMRTLFQYGFERAKAGFVWATEVPGFDSPY